MSMKLLVSFPDQSTSFTYGVEYGRLLEKIERGDNVITNSTQPIYLSIGGTGYNTVSDVLVCDNIINGFSTAGVY